MYNLKKLFVFLRIWPVILVLKYRLLRNDKYAELWLQDLGRMNAKSTLDLISQRPYYMDLLYHRIKMPMISISQVLFGSTPFFLSPRTPIGGGVFLEHPYCSRLNAKKIGSNFKCYHGVTFGDNGRGELPIIGDHVTCGAGSCVIGNITIGDNVNIGAGAVVTKTVPSNCTVIGNPAIIVRLNNQKVNIPLLS